VVAGFIGLLLVRHRSWSSVVHGIAGAWVGFIAGAIVAIILDVVLGSGTLLPVLGHAAAAALLWRGPFRSGSQGSSAT
jgi:uncharacterized membrane protein YoaK (UPF0700 family)